MNNNTIARTLTRVIRLSAIAALLAGLLAVTQPPRVLPYVVTTSANNGTGSLREAIDDAKDNPGADTITFDAAATDGKPIVLSGAPGEDFNSSGDLDILDGGDLTIQGNGAANTIIDGGGIDRVFHVCPDGGCTNTVTLSGVTIRNGSADFGAGILNWGTLNVQASSAVSTNAANSVGGGIFNRNTLNIQNGSTVSDNTAGDDGGGIYNREGTTTVDGSTISANGADNGGGIYNKGTLNVKNGSTIGGAGAANTATFVGGGIYNDVGGTTTVDDSTVSANEASSGGGIANNATLNIQKGSTIGGAGAGNTAIYGGGIFNREDTTTVNGSTVSANTADKRGGGIYNKAMLNVLGDSTIGGVGAANTANKGGGIYNFLVTTTVTGGRIMNNTAVTDGGGIYNDDGTTTVTVSCVLNNTAANGGGVFSNTNDAGATSVTGSNIVGNSTTSFINNQPALQIATGNWWGAATGPNTLGADTVSVNVNTIGYLTEPIPGCGFYVYLPLVLK